MDLWISIILLYATALSSLRFAWSLPYSSVCDHEFEVFRYGIEAKCPFSLYPNPPLEVDGSFLDRIVDSKQGNAYMSILFYASWCPFSCAVRPKFDVLSSMFPQIDHLVVEHSHALPSVFSRCGIHSLPAVLMVNQTSKVRYHGQKDISSLIQFYERTTGLQPVQYVAEGEPTSSGSDGTLITRLCNGSSVKEIVKTEQYLVLALLFLCLKAAILVFPLVLLRMKAFWASSISHLNLGVFGETSQLFSRALHMIDVRRIWMKLRLTKMRNFHERAKNARVWASSLASVSLGKSSSGKSLS